MEKLFEYSKYVENQDFVGRKSEVERLAADFVFLNNSIILAPQGWGKSSLVRRAASVARAKDKRLRFCHVSLSNVRDEEHFYELLAQSVLCAISSTIEEAAGNAARFFQYPAPKVGFSSSSSNSLTIDFDWNDVRKYKAVLLDVPVRVAQETDLRLVVCIDDFHMAATFENSEEFIRLVQQHWQSQKNVAYCLSAEENVMMSEFIKTSNPISRTGDIMRLGKISPSDFSRHLREKFADSGKYLDAQVASLIIDLARNHPFHVQQLAHVAWMNTSVVCSAEVVHEAHETIVNQMSMLFSTITSSLTSQQLCYLHAVLAGETVISKSEVLHRHRISSATSASRSKAALLQKGIICDIDGRIVLADPIYSYWLKNIYFN